MVKSAAGVSVVIPHFECMEFLPAAVNSVGPYLRPQDEIVIADDGSRESTYDVVAEFLATTPFYSQITLLRHEENLGGGAARNTAVRAAQNGWIFCLDSDNIASKNLVPILLDYAIRNDIDVVSPEQIVFFDDDPASPTHSWKYSATGFSVVDHLLDSKIPSSSGNYLYSKESWSRAGGYPVDAGALDAWGFGFNQVATGSTMKVVPDSYYLHRYGHSSYWTKNFRRHLLKMRRDAKRIVLSQRDAFPEPYAELLNKKSTWPKFVSKEVFPRFKQGHSRAVGVELSTLEIKELAKAQQLLVGP